MQPSKITSALASRPAADGGLQEEMVHAGWQEAYVLQRSSGGCGVNALQNRPDESVLMMSVCSRMRTRGGRFSSGVRKAATPSSPAFPQTFRAPTGSLGSPLWPRIANSCLHVRRNRTRKTGSLPFRPLSTDPCCLRIMQVCYSRLPIFYLCAPPPKTRVFSTFSLQWRHFLNTNHEWRGHRRRRWSLHQHNPHHLPGPHHQVEDPIQR